MLSLLSQNGIFLMKAASSWDTTTGQRMLLITSVYSILCIHTTHVRVNGDLAVENVAPVTIGVAMCAELVSLNLSTMAWMYML